MALIKYNDLEIHLLMPDRDRYMVIMRFTNPDSRVFLPPVSGWTALVPEGRADQQNPQGSSNTISLDDLKQDVNDPLAYGKKLTNAVLSSPEIKTFLEAARASTETDNKDLRLRLFIDSSAQELHDLRWETMLDPRDDTWLAANPRLPFSRFLTNPSWKPVHLRRQSKLRALVVIANPLDIEDYNDGGRSLTRVDVSGELQSAKEGLGSQIQIDEMVTDQTDPGRVTLEKIEKKLNEGTGYDILYLVCHGVYLYRLEPPGPYIFLEDQDGKVCREPGAKFKQVLQNIDDEKRPRLVALASCQSSGAPGETKASDVKGTLARLGPMLAQAGVPAVLAWQGDVSQVSVSIFIKKFFEVLRTTGLVDVAAAYGRQELKNENRLDRWMPVIYHRLQSACLWYVPEFNGDVASMLWSPLMDGLADDGRYVAIVGPALSEYVCGPLQQVAHKLADQQSFPLRQSSSDELQIIAQYLSIRSGSGKPRRALIEHYQQQVQERFAPQLAGVVPGEKDTETLASQLAEICRQRLSNHPLDANHILAHLPFKVYLNVNPDNMLEQALVQAGRTPIVDYARWKPELNEILPNRKRKTAYEPSIKKPLLFHMFGTLRLPDSLVLTEDDYMSYLLWIGNAWQSELTVSAYLSTPGLLFLGFNAFDWNFRVLYRSMRLFAGLERKYKSVAVQVTPGEDMIHPELARAYLQEYLGETQVRVYWGSVSDFVEELWNQADKWEKDNNKIGKLRL